MDAERQRAIAQRPADESVETPTPRFEA